MNFIIFFFLTLPLFAQSELDHKLQEYVAHFNLKSLDRPLPTKPGLFKLGEKLFADHILSGNDNISCGSCHHPDAGTADGMPFGLGEGSNGIQTATTHRNQGQGTLLARSTPPLFNLSGVNTMFWDGRVSFDPITKTFATPAPLPPEVANTLTSALAAQALFPMVNHAEMRGKTGSNPIADTNNESEAWELILKKVMSNPSYRDEFSRIYPGQKINIGHVAEAIAEFERLAFFNADTPYDSYLRGNLTAMTEIQKIGMDVFFNKGKCGECHTGEHLSNFEFHSVGTPQTGPGNNQGDDFGRQEHDPKAGLYAFRVPPLRNVAMTAPYMHDGVFKTLSLIHI